ncbi:A24 family peptidase [Salinimonas lutimaris]|uniref:A24 family peptidase n=1 Tax=Salinimonas lutimaris TaxID=914153 RepID=UPI0010C11306|nr:prepilin peptidase [Salinimonas lutimaris]
MFIALTLLLFAIAIISDLRSYRIPNQLCFFFIALGLLLNLITGGLSELTYALLACLLMFALLLPLFALNMLGAGDVKLMMAVGALLGPTISLWSLAWGIAVGGLLTVIVAAFKTGWNGIKKTAHRYFLCFCMRRYVRPESDELGAVTVPYAPALALGFAITCYRDPSLIQSFIQFFAQAGI